MERQATSSSAGFSVDDLFVSDLDFCWVTHEMITKFDGMKHINDPRSNVIHVNHQQSDFAVCGGYDSDDQIICCVAQENDLFQ